MHMINHVIFPMFRMIIYIFKHLHIVLYQNNVIIIPKVFMYQFLVIWYKTILKLKQLQKSISCFTPKPPNWINMYLNYFCILVFNFVKLWRFYCIYIHKKISSYFVPIYQLCRKHFACSTIYRWNRYKAC